MTSRSVSIKRTDCSQQELIQALIYAWDQIFYCRPTKEQIGIIWAQHAMETGGSTSMYNYNIGLVAKSYDVSYNIISIEERSKIKDFTFNYDASPIFMSFDSLYEGAGFYLKYLKGIKYKSAWSAIEANDPLQFMHLLKLANYYAAPEEDYIAAGTVYIKQFVQTNYYERAIQDLGLDIKIKPKQSKPLSRFTRIKRLFVDLWMRLFFRIVDTR